MTTRIAYAPGPTIGGILGCTPIPGADGTTESGPCARCWARGTAHRFGFEWFDPPHYDRAHDVWTRIHALPVARPDRRRIFAWPMGDPLHEAIPLGWLATAIRAMALRQDRDFLLLTKRPERYPELARVLGDQGIPWPANVWPGASVWDQSSADRLRAVMSSCSVPVWLSVEPLLGSIDWSDCSYSGLFNWLDLGGARWVIVGCESGPGARPCPTEWIESIVRQCRDSGVPVWAKQARANADGTGRLIHRPEILGRVWEEVPDAL